MKKLESHKKAVESDILLIHGTLLGRLKTGMKFIDTLAQNYRVTAFDRLGHGYSSSNEYTYHLKENAILVENLVKQLNLKSPLIVGHSYGGSIAAFMAVNSKLIDIEYVIIDSPLYAYQPSKLYQLVASPNSR